MKPSWYDIKMEDGDDADHAEIYIYTPIGASMWEERVDAKTFVKELDELDVSKITLRINSPGGSVWDGVAIHNALRRHKAEVTCVVEGVCASIATIIALAADKLLMCATSWWMIHNASAVAWGNAAALRKTTEMLDKIDKGAIAAYAAKTGKDREWVAEEMAREAWYTPEEALEHGFIDGVLDDDEDAEATAFERIDPVAIALFRNPPEQLTERLRPAAGPIPQLPTTPAEPVALEGIPQEDAPAPPAAEEPPSNLWEVDVARARRERESASV